jgi:uncharacterized protein involved in response to NO
MGSHTLEHALPQSVGAWISWFFSLGFRPFFLAAGVHATLAMLLWLAMLMRPELLVPGMGSNWWHAHEMLFGYLGAVICGFLLTAVPNWTARSPLARTGVACLFSVWLLARFASLLAPPAIWSAVLDCLLFVGLAGYLWREIVASGNRRNIGVAMLISAFALTHALWYWELMSRGFADLSLRLMLAGLLCLLMVIGGRLVPNFSRNWLKQQGISTLPASSGWLDVSCISITLIALASWLLAPFSTLTAVSTLTAIGLFAAAVANLIRLARWYGWRTFAEPLVTILHIGYLWLPVGLALLGGEILWPDVFVRGMATHALTAGAVGTMTAAVMTRATLGHSGQALSADRITVAIYGLVWFSALVRVLAVYGGSAILLWYQLAGILWVAGFGLFSYRYGRYFLRAS